MLSLMLLPLLFSLGLWQLERAEQKRQLIRAYDEKAQQSPVMVNNPSALNTFDTDSLNGLPAQLNGEFDTQRYWLVDNKIRQGRSGYEVVVPFYPAEQRNKEYFVLVNIGWVAAPLSRDQLPDVSLPTSTLVSGRFSKTSSNAIFNSATAIENDHWPKRVLHIDHQSAREQLNKQSIDIWLLIAATDPSALITQWQFVNQSPAKHMGYAVQWFAMSAALAIALLFANSNLAQVMRVSHRDGVENNKNKGESLS